MKQRVRVICFASTWPADEVMVEAVQTNNAEDGQHQYPSKSTSNRVERENDKPRVEQIGDTDGNQHIDERQNYIKRYIVTKRRENQGNEDDA